MSEVDFQCDVQSPTAASHEPADENRLACTRNKSIQLPHGDEDSKIQREQLS